MATEVETTTNLITSSAGVSWSRLYTEATSSQGPYEAGPSSRCSDGKVTMFIRIQRCFCMKDEDLQDKDGCLVLFGNKQESHKAAKQQQMVLIMF